MIVKAFTQEEVELLGAIMEGIRIMETERTNKKVSLFNPEGFKETEAEKITEELFRTNPLKTLIDIKKLVKQLPTNGKVENTIQRQKIVKMIESYDDGYIAREKYILPAIKGIVTELCGPDFRVYDGKDILPMIFKDKELAITIVKSKLVIE
jgi:hypothetical protein